MDVQFGASLFRTWKPTLLESNKVERIHIVAFVYHIWHEVNFYKKISNTEIAVLPEIWSRNENMMKYTKIE